MAVWLRGSSVQDPRWVWASQVLQVSFPKVSRALSRIAVSLVAPRHTAIATKTAPLQMFSQALSKVNELFLS